MAGISCVDCIGPAFELMKKRLFQPFRLGFWSRIAILGIFAGEFGGGRGARGSHFNYPPNHQHIPLEQLGLSWAWVAQHWNWIMGLIGAAVFVGLFFLYLGSVLRFVLLEAVLRDKARIREGFSRWAEEGFSYFLFRIMFAVPVMVLAVFLVIVPLLAVIKAGGGTPALGAALAGMIGGIILVVLVGIVVAIIMVLTKDFVLPQMVYEGVGCGEGWGRLWKMIQEEPGKFFGYVVLKIGLSICAAIVMGIGIVVLLAFSVVALAIVGGIGYALLSALSKMMLIGLAIAFLLVVALPMFIFCVGFIGAPISVFFPAYSLYFFAGRYKPLNDELYPPSAPSAEAPSAQPA